MTAAFVAPVADILTAITAAGADRLANWDRSLAAEVIGHFAAFAEAEIAPTNALGDRQGCTICDGRVKVPFAFRNAYAQLAAQGWQGLGMPAEFGGMAMNAVIGSAISEIFTGANHSLQMLTALAAGAARTLGRFGTDAQRKAYIPLLASGDWLSTMCLTEAGAGSDLAMTRARAQRTETGWRLDGEKTFISGGDHDLTPDILHLVLARSLPSEPGVRGLSLFLCPSTRRDGSRNGVSVVRIEEKLGLHGSPTCQLAFEGAEADLLGVEGQGLAAMFTMMNHARLDVAFQGVAHAARAADLSRRYAAERRQGRDALGQPTTIDQHAAVRDMIEEQDMLALGARVMCLQASVALETGESTALVEFLTPVCKVFATSAGIRAADLAIQVMGGYGYLEDYGAAQNWRDARVTAIYEGTNEIHALTLVTRLLRSNSGEAADAFAAFIARAVEVHDSAALRTVFEHWLEARRLVMTLQTPAPVATDFMALTGEVAFQAAWESLAANAVSDERLLRLRRRAASRPWSGIALAAIRSSLDAGFEPHGT